MILNSCYGVSHLFIIYEICYLFWASRFSTFLQFFRFFDPNFFLSFRCNRHLEPFMCKVSSQVLREPKAKNWPVKVFRKPQSLISEGHEKFSANRTCSGVCRVPCLRYLCRIKVEDDYKRMKSEVEIRNGNGRIDKSKCKKHRRCSVYSRMLVYPYRCIYVLRYTCIEV